MSVVLAYFTVCILCYFLAAKRVWDGSLKRRIEQNIIVLWAEPITDKKMYAELRGQNVCIARHPSRELVTALEVFDGELLARKHIVFDAERV